VYESPQDAEDVARLERGDRQVMVFEGGGVVDGGAACLPLQ
jgi:hypothetical protein